MNGAALIAAGLPTWAQLGALAPLVVGIGAAVAKAFGNGRKLDAVHVLVNSRLTDALNAVAELEDKLAVLGVAVDPSTAGTRPLPAPIERAAS